MQYFLKILKHALRLCTFHGNVLTSAGSIKIGSLSGFFELVKSKSAMCPLNDFSSKQVSNQNKNTHQIYSSKFQNEKNKYDDLLSRPSISNKNENHYHWSLWIWFSAKKMHRKCLWGRANIPSSTFVLPPPPPSSILWCSWGKSFIGARSSPIAFSSSPYNKSKPFHLCGALGLQTASTSSAPPLQSTRGKEASVFSGCTLSSGPYPSQLA